MTDAMRMGTKMFSFRLSEEEYEELAKQAKEQGKTMKEVLFGRIQAGAIHNHERIEEGARESLKDYDPSDASYEVMKAIKDNTSWVGGYDVVQVSKDVSKHLKWDGMTEADRFFLLGYYRAEEPELNDIDRTLTKVADNLLTDLPTVKRFFRRVKVSYHEVEGEWKKQFLLDESAD